MNYVIYHEFGKRKLTTQDNYDAIIQDASKVVDLSNFASDESAKEWLVSNTWAAENQIIIIR